MFQIQLVLMEPMDRPYKLTKHYRAKESSGQTKKGRQ